MEAYEDGWWDYMNGNEPYDNPYPKKSNEYETWQRGYRAAKEKYTPEVELK